MPSSYRAAFLRAGQAGMLSKELSGDLARAAGLRNILVHEYAEIDYALLHKSIPSAIRDFTAFIRISPDSSKYIGSFDVQRGRRGVVRCVIPA